MVIVDSWPNFESKGKGTETSGPPQDLLFANGQLITMAFVPATATVPKPPASAITNLLTSLSQGTTTTTHRPADLDRRPPRRRDHADHHAADHVDHHRIDHPTTTAEAAK